MKEKKPNHLEKEKSPYLLQHAYNPIQWYPWGQEALDKARRENKPIFLSIGYSTCHWCHVMARESFEDPQVAGLLNEHFVSIKVDREERPDVDAVYMAVCQALTGSGGWPLTLLLDPQQNPFFAGTYLPRHGRFGSTGLWELLDSVSRKWEQDPESLCQMGRKITAYLREQEENRERQGTVLFGQIFRQEKSLIGQLLEEAELWLEQNFDEENGGFGKTPKFPQAHQLLFLLNYGIWKKEDRPIEMAEKTLQRMYRGGIFDQIGGGFSRYSTDDQWLVPHFEKMLYDNALLADAYLEAFRLTKKPEYREAVQRIFSYAERELMQQEGGFSCGQDADSEGEEGKYYVFMPEEILDVLGEERGSAFCSFYHITKEGNFEGKSIPNRLGEEDEEYPFWWEEALDLLLDYRKRRTRLHLDDKVLTSWNCLMIGAYARAAVILKNPEYEKTAQNSMSFLRKHLKNEKGDLHIRWRDGQADFPGQLEDYAFYALACLDLYEAGKRKEDFQEGVWAVLRMHQLFQDPKGKGYFRYCPKTETLIIQPKEAYDGAIPSGNGAAALALAKLYHLTGSPRIWELLERQCDYLIRILAGFPAGHTVSLLAFLEMQKKRTVCAVDGSSEECRLQALQNMWLEETAASF